MRRAEEAEEALILIRVDGAKADTVTWLIGATTRAPKSAADCVNFILYSFVGLVWLVGWLISWFVGWLRLESIDELMSG
jgi:hypothetical protein